jgi:hypothetical protein
VLARDVLKVRTVTKSEICSVEYLEQKEGESINQLLR